MKSTGTMIALVAAGSMVVGVMAAPPAAAPNSNRTPWERYKVHGRPGSAAQPAQVVAASTTEAASSNSSKGRLEGTWRVTGTFQDNSTESALFTFGAGKNATGGTVVHSDSFFLVAAPSCLTAQGTWKKTGGGSFVATDEGFCFDPENGFAPAGSLRFRSAVTLTQQGAEFDGTTQIDGLDVDGNVVFTDSFTLHGVRMEAEGPASAAQ